MEVRTGHLFKFSDKELHDLDSLVDHFNQATPEIWYWKKVNRSDVIRKLVRDRVSEIESKARQQLDAEIASKPEAKNGKSKRRKAVKV